MKTILSKNLERRDKTETGRLFSMSALLTFFKTVLTISFFHKSGKKEVCRILVKI